MKDIYPEHFARFYDTIYHKINSGADNRFYQDEIKRTKGRILEIGVGTGRLFINALNNGADIYGIDISRSMLNVLKVKVNNAQHYRISQQNILDFRFDFKFDLIIAPFRVFMHLSDKKDQICALNKVYNHLNDGGRFIFDTFVPDLKQLIKGIENIVDFDGEYEPGKRLKRSVSTKPDLINQIIYVKFVIEWEDINGVKSKDWEFTMRFFFRFEIEHLIERSEFETYRILGDYSGNELNQESKEFITICTRQNKL